VTAFISLEPEARRELLRSFGAIYDLNILVETGTNEGKTPLALQNSFAEIYTIELHPGLYADAVSLFANTVNVTCVHGDSAQVLPWVLALFDGPALVWLDGHHSGPGTAHGRDSSPIRDELRILFEDGRKHVILVDDARIFDGGPEHLLYDHYLDYPSLQWVEVYAAEFGYRYVLEDDIIRLTPT
jgi:hypothetical protein